jgi:hypothetical protein
MEMQRGQHSKALRVELKHEGWPISVTRLMPGSIRTPFFDKGRTKLGVKPVDIPPIYEPETVANIILYAVENPARDLVCGGAAQALILNQRLSPPMLDAVLTTRAGFSPQVTEEPRYEEDSDNLCALLYRDTTRRETASGRSREASTTGCRYIRQVRRGLAVGTALGLLAALRRRS